MLAAPPKLDLPAEVKGEPGAFVVIPAKTEGKNVEWKVIDPGLNLFPVELLKDTKTAVVSGARPGRYRVIAATAGGDEVSPFAETVVVLGNPPKTPTDPPVDPPTDPPVQPAVYYFLIVRPDGPASPGFTEIMQSPAWTTLRTAGHSFKPKTVTEAAALGVVLPPGTIIPCVVTLKVSEDGKRSTIVRGPIPLPTTADGIAKLPEGVK